MKYTKLNVNSWHYKLAESVGYDPDNNDICSYTRRVIVGIFCLVALIVFIAATSAAISFLLVHMVLGAYFYFAYGLVPAFEFFFGWGIVIVSAICAACNLSYLKLKERKYLRDTEEKEPSFFVTAYRSWKDKFCVKLQFVDKD